MRTPIPPATFSPLVSLAALQEHETIEDIFYALLLMPTYWPILAMELIPTYLYIDQKREKGTFASLAPQAVSPHFRNYAPPASWMAYQHGVAVGSIRLTGFDRTHAIDVASAAMPNSSTG